MPVSLPISLYIFSISLTPIFPFHLKKKNGGKTDLGREIGIKVVCLWDKRTKNLVSALQTFRPYSLDQIQLMAIAG